MILLSKAWFDFMAIFSKLDKKVLTDLVIAIFVVLLIAFIIYQYFVGSAVKVNNSVGGVQTEIKK